MRARHIGFVNFVLAPRSASGVVLGALLWAMALGAAPARAQPDAGAATVPNGPVELEEDSARSHFRVGQLMYGEGRFDEAAAEFDRAYELSGRSQLLYNAYLAHRDAGHVSEAAARLRQYLDETPDAADRETLELRLAAMQETLAQQEREASMSAEERAALEAERARVAAEARGHAAEAERLRTESDREAQRRNPTPSIIMGVGAGVLVAGVILGVVTQTTSLADLKDNCPNNRCTSGFDLEATRSEARRRTIATDVLLGVGAATTVTGLVLFLVQRRRFAAADDAEEDAAARERHTEVAGGCGPQGCHMNLQVTF